jgi:hypothetical protein
VIRLRTAFVVLAATALGGALLTAPSSAAPAGESARAANPGAGDDTQRHRIFRCSGKRATIVGTNRKDRLFGTRRADVIVGRGKGDVILGLGRRDTICGGKGNDVLDGGGTRLDHLYGNGGRDFCSGERTEHRFHVGCEVHRPSLNAHPPHHQPRASATPVTKAEALRMAGAWFDYQYPYCYFAGINSGDVYLRGDYTQPGYVAVAQGTSYFNFATGNWVGASEGGARFRTWEVPTDGQLHAANFGNYAAVAGGASTRSYFVWWWNGAEWVDLNIYPIVAFANDDEAGGYVYSDVCLT